MEAILNIIKSIDADNAQINPTEIYNEGWMTRILTYYSIQEKLNIGEVDFSRVNNWSSEALISSPFVYAKEYREGYTHADMALGDFKVEYEKRGKIIIQDTANLFGIIEAKMGSNLTQGTTKVERYNQASRNVACIAYNTLNIDCEIFFGVVGPKTKLDKHDILNQIDPDFIYMQIEDRFNMYSDEFQRSNNMPEMLKRVRQCKTWMITYEQWIDKFKNKEINAELSEFYNKALKYNKI